MENNIINAKGLLCPKPLILTKKAINEGNENFIIIVDNDIAKENIQRFLKDNNKDFNIKEKDNNFYIEVGIDNIKITSDPVEYCSYPVKRNSVICFKNNRMGTGNDDLGEILMKAFINTIIELDTLPSSLIFYNNGVKLTIESSGVFKSLKELEDKDVKLLICGTCVDFFNIKDQIKIGIISNMYVIMEELNNADKIIYP